MLAVLIRVVARVLSMSFFRDSRGCILDEGAPLPPFARAAFCRCFFSFLAVRSFRASRAILRGSWSTSINGEPGYCSPQKIRTTCVPALAGTSVIHCSSTCLFLPSLPHLLTHSCFSSSHTFLSRTFFCIPLTFAKASHFVGGLGFGKGFVRGSW